MGRKNTAKPLRHTESILRGHLPPHALDAECAVLGGIMLNPDALEYLEGILSSEQFYIEANRNIFSAILELAQHHKPVDALTVKDELERSKCLDAYGGEAYLVELIGSVPTSSNVRYYAEIVREKAVLRHLLQVCNVVSRDVYDKNSDHKGVAEIIVAKQRNGPIDTVRLAFLSQYTRFENLSHDEGFYD